MKQNNKKLDPSETIQDIGISTFIDLLAFLNVNLNSGTILHPNNLDIVEEIQNTRLTDEDYIGQFITRHRNEDLQLILAADTTDFERLLVTHQFGVNSMPDLSRDDQVEYIVNVEIPTIKNYLDSLVTHWGSNYKDKDSLLRIAQKYYWFLQNTLDAYNESKLQGKPKRKKKMQDVIERISNSNLWGHCFIKEKDLSYSDQLFDNIVNYIRAQVELDRKSWGEHKIFYMSLWQELKEKGYLSEEYRKLPKTKAIVILRNTFPDQILNEHIAKEMGRNKLLIYKNPVKGKIPEYEYTKEYFKAFFNFKNKESSNPIKFDPEKFELREINGYK